MSNENDDYALSYLVQMETLDIALGGTKAFEIEDHIEMNEEEAERIFGWISTTSNKQSVGREWKWQSIQTCKYEKQFENLQETFKIKYSFL